jgi:hypothetical protein
MPKNRHSPPLLCGVLGRRPNCLAAPYLKKQLYAGFTRGVNDRSCQQR